MYYHNFSCSDDDSPDKGNLLSFNSIDADTDAAEPLHVHIKHAETIISRDSTDNEFCFVGDNKMMKIAKLYKKNA